MRGTRKGIEPAAPIPPANDKPLIDRRELEWSQASLRSYHLTPQELAEADERCKRRGNWQNNPGMYRPTRRYKPPAQF